jgi:putative membrane protein insertion efficiency factor
MTKAVVETDPALDLEQPARELPRSPGPIARLLAGLVRLYQLVVSPWLGPSCRFEPSCSAYALEALRVHGAARGSWLTLRRLGRCQPFCTGGYDPVPEPRHRKERCATESGHLADLTAPVDESTPSPDHVSPSRPLPDRGPSSQSPVASGSPDRGVPAC